MWWKHTGVNKCAQADDCTTAAPLNRRGAQRWQRVLLCGTQLLWCFVLLLPSCCYFALNKQQLLIISLSIRTVFAHIKRALKQKVLCQKIFAGGVFSSSLLWFTNNCVKSGRYLCFYQSIWMTVYEFQHAETSNLRQATKWMKQPGEYNRM